MADPDYVGPVQVVDQRDVLVPLVIRDLIDTESLEPTDAMAFAQPTNQAMEQVRQGQGGYPQQHRGRLLGHDLAIAQYQVLRGDRSAGVGIVTG